MLPNVGDEVRLIKSWGQHAPPLGSVATVTGVLGDSLITLSWHKVVTIYRLGAPYEYHGWFELADGGPW